MLKDIIDLIKNITKEDPGKWLNDTSAVIAELKLADTPEKKLAAAKKLQSRFADI